MNIKEIVNKLNKRYIFLIEGEMIISGHFRFKVKYENIEFIVTYTYTGMVSFEENYKFICNKIENALIDYFKRSK